MCVCVHPCRKKGPHENSTSLGKFRCETVNACLSSSSWDGINREM